MSSYAVLKYAYPNCGYSSSLAGSTVENFNGGGFAIYSSIKANPRRFDESNTCLCKKSICGQTMNEQFPVQLCADCRFQQ
jgi:hypothetical protein